MAEYRGSVPAAKKSCTVDIREERLVYKWKKEEELMVATFIAEIFTKYKFNKTEILRNIISKIQLQCSLKQLRNKVQSMEKLYKDTKGKFDNTGGLRETDHYANFCEKMLAQCPYYDIFNEVIGERANVTPPDTFDTSTNTIKVEDVNNFVYIEPEMISTSSSSRPHSSSEGTVSPMLSAEIKMGTVGVSDELKNTGRRFKVAKCSEAALASAIAGQVSASESLARERILLERYRIDKQNELDRERMDREE